MSVVHFVPDKEEEAASALEEAGIPYSKRNVVLVDVLDKPGVLGEVALVMSNAGINIDYVYCTVKGLVVFGVDDVDGATQVASGMAVMVSD